MTVATRRSGTQPTLAHYNQIIDYPCINQVASQSDYAIIHLSKPFTGLGAMGIQPNFAGGAVHITGYLASAGGLMVDSTQTVTVDPNFTTLMGTPTGEGLSGGPEWVYGAGGNPYVVGLVSAESVATGANGQSIGFNLQTTAPVLKQIMTWESQDDSGVAGPFVQVYDTTGGTWVPDALTHLYTGPVPGIQEQYVDISPDSVNITAKAPNYFIHTGSGNDAVALLSGTNVVDGGAGSNFLTSGTDTFYVDDCGASTDIWSTVARSSPLRATPVWPATPPSTVPRRPRWPTRAD